MYSQGLSIGDGFFNVVWVEAGVVEHPEVARGFAVEGSAEVSVFDGDSCVQK